MKVGDKVKRKHNDFLFEGQVIGILYSTNGREVIAVEQKDTWMVMCFYANQLFVDDGFGWVEGPNPVAPMATIPLPKQKLPFEIFIPVKAIPTAGANRRVNAELIRQKFLPQLQREQLILDKVHAHVEFHFAFNRSGDLDNLLKPTLDLLKGSVIRDDGQIASMYSEYFENAPVAGFRIILSKYEKKEAPAAPAGSDPLPTMPYTLRLRPLPVHEQ